MNGADFGQNFLPFDWKCVKKCPIIVLVPTGTKYNKSGGNIMKKLLAMLLAIVMIVGLMAACNGGDETKPSETPTQGGSAENPTQGAADVPTEPTRANEERYGGHLDVCIQSNPTGLDPNKQTGTWKYIWTDCVYENALTRDAEDKIAPGVCDYELSEDMLTLKLWPREGITFHDGTPVEAEDVLASIKRACSMNATRQKVIVDVAESMTIEGNVLTIKFKEYKEQTLYYLAAWQTWIAVMPCWLWLSIVLSVRIWALTGRIHPC